MKKFLTVISILSLVFCSISGLSEGIDLKSMSDEELIGLVSSALTEAAERNVILDTFYWPGDYTVGEDLEPGEYLITYVKRADPYKTVGTIAVYESEESYNDSKSGELYLENMSEGGTQMMKLSEKNYVRVLEGIMSFNKLR